MSKLFLIPLCLGIFCFSTGIECSTLSIQDQQQSSLIVESSGVVVGPNLPRYVFKENTGQLSTSYFSFLSRKQQSKSIIYKIRGNYLCGYEPNESTEVLAYLLPFESDGLQSYLTSSLIYEYGHWKEIVLGMVGFTLFIFDLQSRDIKWTLTLEDRAYSKPMVVKLQNQGWCVMVLKLAKLGDKANLLCFDVTSGHKLTFLKCDFKNFAPEQFIAVDSRSASFVDVIFFYNKRGEIWVLNLSRISGVELILRRVSEIFPRDGWSLLQVFIVSHSACDFAIVSHYFNDQEGRTLITMWLAGKLKYSKKWEHIFVEAVSDVLVRQNRVVLNPSNSPTLKVLSLESGQVLHSELNIIKVDEAQLGRKSWFYSEKT